MKKVFTILLILIMLTSLVSCGPGSGGENYETHTGLTKIEGEKSLWYDPDTGVVYIIFSEKSYNLGYGYMSPYIAPNGKPYKYDENKGLLVEIN